MATRLDSKSPLGKLILQKLYLMGKNQAWLAEQMNVNMSHISIICSKTKNPRFETLFKISKILDIEISELYQAVAENFENKGN